jgi:predicted metal-binding membrane protein
MATERSAVVTDGRALRGPDLVVPVVAGISIAAWLALWWWGLDAGGHAHHDGVAEPAAGRGALALGIGWLAMVAAMMLPLAADVLGVVSSRVRGLPRGGLLVGLTGLGFVAPWLAIGLLLYLADGGLAAVVGGSGWLQAHTGALTGGAVAGAGAYQLTELKRRSLIACRSPAAVVARGWQHGGRPEAGALRTGVAFGRSCVACCWALMALTLMAGAAGMMVMMFFAGVMLIESMTPWGPAFARRIGAVLLLVGLAWLALSLLA